MDSPFGAAEGEAFLSLFDSVTVVVVAVAAAAVADVDGSIAFFCNDGKKEICRDRARQSFVPKKQLNTSRHEMRCSKWEQTHRRR
jgi:hypothetical protein